MPLAIVLASTHASASPSVWAARTAGEHLSPSRLRTEYLINPLGIDSPHPRLGWIVESSARGQKQTAYRILVAGTREALRQDRGELWDSGRVASGKTLNVAYDGKPLLSGRPAFWKLKVWDRSGVESEWSAPAQWSMGLRDRKDWTAQWISYRDSSPLYKDRGSLYLPPARHYRKEFRAGKRVKRATIYASALGLFRLQVNGRPVDDAYFEPGWSDYVKRAYYRTHDVTSLLRKGENAIGAVVSDGWYAGYVGYGLLVGYGPNRAGRYFYGKTPALLAQLEIEYADGSRETVVTDSSWRVSGDGPIREADLLMGEAYDSRRDRPGWCRPGGATDWKWEPAIRAEENGSTKAVFSDNRGNREVELGFQPPHVLQSYSAPPIRVTQTLKAKRITEPKPGVYIYDLGQNFAGIVRLKVKGAAGTRVQLRFGEMLHKDGRLMTENLRRARATDFYTLRGDPRGETWEPQFTYHGFQYAEVTGLPEKPGLDAVTGLVLHNDTPLTSSFECSDDVMTKFWKNTQWTQRANFVEVPTDCPQRDERLGWMGDAQTYARTATYNADVAAFYTKWLDDVAEAQQSFGAYPDYCPYPMGHGEPGKTFGTAWTDAGIICPWTVWRVYGDTRAVERHWDSMSRFMEWRKKAAPDGLGKSIGNPWGDWLSVGETTSVEFVDTCYYAHDASLMADMAEAIGRAGEAAGYRALRTRIESAFVKEYVNAGGTLKQDTQSAYALALAFDLIPKNLTRPAANRLADKIAKNGFRMTTGFLGTVRLLPALSAAGYHDLAVRLFQSRKFPSWGYEVANGANTVWERWDSFTAEHGFNGEGGNQNAAMNSFSHYSFGAVMEWGFKTLAGIDTEVAGFERIVIAPGPPTNGSNPDNRRIDWVRADYDSPRGKIAVAWKREAGRFVLDVTVPANTFATILLPASSAETVTEGGKPLVGAEGVRLVRYAGDRAVLAAGSGSYHFESTF